MANVGIIYVAQTKHVLACVTIAGELASQTKVADLVDQGLFLRHPQAKGQVLFFPSANDAMKVVSAQVEGSALQQLLTAPARMSIPDEKVPGGAAGTPQIANVTFPATQITFTLTAPSQPLQCLLAHQRGAATIGNPATLIPEVINPGETTKTIPVNYAEGDFLALFVEGLLPVVQ